MSLFDRPRVPPPLPPMPADPLRTAVAAADWARWPTDWQSGLAPLVADRSGGAARAATNLATMRKALEGFRRTRGLVADGLRAAAAAGTDPQWSLIGSLRTAVHGPGKAA